MPSLKCVPIFGTLIADEDGVYDANDPNDRLLLGLKGIMSEMELHIMRNRLDRGRDNKAQRGELFHGVPMGYVILPTGEVDFDPDEQAREVVQLIFDKFDELGSIYGLFHWLIRHDIQLPIRPRTGAKKGQLEWRRPSIPTLAQMLRHPIYAGAYAYGRRPIDPKRTFSPGNRYRPWVPMEQWKVLLKDHLPAYISWDQFLKNRERIKQNQNGPDSVGVPRVGAALLSGVLVCGNCDRHMQPSYHGNGMAQYGCNRQYVEATEPRCYGLAARVIDELVSQQVLQALEPAALELSLKARADVERERHASRKALAATADSAHVTTSSWPNVATRPSIPRTAWWRRLWKNAGKNCLARKGNSKRNTIGSRGKRPINSPMRNGHALLRWLPTFQRCGMLPARRTPIGSRSFAAWWTVWSCRSAATVNSSM